MFGSAIRRRSSGIGSRRLVALPLAAVVALSLAACGSGSSTTPAASGSGASSSGAASSAEVAAAEERLAPQLIPVSETKISVDTPLTQKPETGKKVTLARFNNPAAARTDDGFKAAAAALGWELTINPVDGADPQAQPNAVIRAVSEGADYVIVNSASVASLGKSLDIAKEKGVPVFFFAGIDEPQGAANGVYGNTIRTTTEAAVLGMIDYAIVKSGATASVLMVNAPDFAILAPIDEAAKKHVASNCKGCSIENLGISAADLGGDIASQIVARLRQNPDIKYVVPTFTSLANGLAPALKAAGLDDVQVYVSGALEPDVEQIKSGVFPAGNVYPRNESAWLMIDQIARVSVGMDALQAEHDTTGLQLWTTDTVPAGDGTWDPPNYQEEYKKLWQIS
jgi:ABC-type sugar transport system substrate-binding protein